MSARQEICAEATRKLAAADVGSISAVIGFDGFVDSIISVVDKRKSAKEFTAMETIALFGQKITAAAGKSANFELVVKKELRGGNAPIMADAISSIGLATTFIGNIGFPEPHPAFAKLVGRAKKIYSVAPPAQTNALEFLDGKIMLGNLGPLDEVTWLNVVEHIGRDKVLSVFEGADLLGMVNWTMVPGMTEIWRGMLGYILPKLTKKAGRRIFVDLADPEKRLKADIVAALEVLKEMDKIVPVTLGLNLSEAIQVNAALDLEPKPTPELATVHFAHAIREKLGIDTVVVHPRGGAAGANRRGIAEIAGPFVQEPKISTGAGDHFNSGFAAGQMLGMNMEESLVMGVGTSGYYVRNAVSPTAAQLAEFIRDLPPPQAK